MKKLSVLLGSIVVLSCQTTLSKDSNSMEKETTPKAVNESRVSESTLVEMNPKYPFIDQLRKEGFGTDTNRLNQLASYVYSDIRKSPFAKYSNVFVNNLDITNCSVLQGKSWDKKDSIFKYSLDNGRGFYLVKVDSNGIGVKNSFDFGLEIWDFNGQDTSFIKKSWQAVYHPMPLYIEVLNNQLYVFYTRRSVDCKKLVEIKNNVMISVKEHDTC